MLVTVMAEADRRWEIWNLSNETQRSLRETAGLNENEHVCSVVTPTFSNGVTGCTEPVVRRRRQYRIYTNTARISGHPGVTVLACGEGYSREDGRDCIAPVRTTMCMDFIKRPDVGSNHAHCIGEVTIRISRSEIGSKRMQPVRQVRSRYEIPVMGTSTKPLSTSSFMASPLSLTVVFFLESHWQLSVLR